MTSADILEKVARQHNLQVGDLLCKARFQHMVNARAEAMRALRKMKLPVVRIARLFQVNETTVRHHTSSAIKASKKSLLRR